MELIAETGTEAVVVRVLADRIDAGGAIGFKERMREMLAHPAPRVILDMSRVTFLDSSGLGAVVAVMKMLDQDRVLELAALTPPVERVFRLTRMDRVFTLHAEAPPVASSVNDN
jgi:anti-sigma B factor antagonist